MLGTTKTQRIGAALAVVAVVAFVAAGAITRTPAATTHVTGTFTGAKVNAGTVTHSKNGKANVLTLSDDFKVPDTPDPHWQVVDSKGNVFLLERLMIKGDKLNKTITLPEDVHDVAKVQIWCAFAETVLGEASFSSPVM